MKTLRTLVSNASPVTSSISVKQAAKMLGVTPPISLRQLLEKLDNSAQQAILKFALSTKSGVWHHIDKAALIEDIRKTVANPLNVQQRSTPLCGPAAIVFELVSRQPQRYVQICQTLYETGQFQARAHQVKPSDTLLHSTLPPGTISVADWMLMATLRDVENALFPVEGDSNNFVMGVTTPWEMKGWCFEILGYNKVAFESTFVYGEIDAMRTAQRVWSRGGVAFLLIDSNLLKGNDPAPFPDHWVAFHGELKLNDNNNYISFKCYSWNSIHTVKMAQEKFEHYMFGAVTGES